MYIYYRAPTPHWFSLNACRWLNFPRFSLSLYVMSFCPTLSLRRCAQKSEQSMAATVRTTSHLSTPSTQSLRRSPRPHPARCSWATGALCLGDWGEDILWEKFLIAWKVCQYRADPVCAPILVRVIPSILGMCNRRSCLPYTRFVSLVSQRQVYVPPDQHHPGGGLERQVRLGEVVRGRDDDPIPLDHLPRQGNVSSLINSEDEASAQHTWCGWTNSNLYWDLAVSR